MNGITEKMLDKKVECLNRTLNTPLTPCTKTKDGTKANVGNYHISKGYEGYTLACVANETGGVNTLTYGSRRHVFTYLNAFLVGYAAGKIATQQVMKEGAKS